MHLATSCAASFSGPSIPAASVVIGKMRRLHDYLTGSSAAQSEAFSYYHAFLNGVSGKGVAASLSDAYLLYQALSVVPFCGSKQAEEAVDTLLFGRLWNDAQFTAVRVLGVDPAVELEALTSLASSSADGSFLLKTLQRGIVLAQSAFHKRGMGDFDGAVADYNQAFQALSEPQGHPWWAAHVGRQRAHLFDQMGKLSEAIESANAAIPLADSAVEGPSARASHEPGWMRGGTRATLAFLLWKQLRDAAPNADDPRVLEILEHFESAESHFTDGSAGCGLPGHHHNLVLLYCASHGDPSLFEVVRDRAARACEIDQKNGSFNLALDHLDLASAHLGLGDHTRAKETLAIARRHADASGRKDAQAEVAEAEKAIAIS